MKRCVSRKPVSCAGVVALILALGTAAGVAADDPHDQIPFIDFDRGRPQLVEGVVSDVDEESVSCWEVRHQSSENAAGIGIGAAEFRYEILVVDVDGVPLRILAPQPTAYRAGDRFRERVLTARPSAFILSRSGYRENVERFRVRLGDLVERYARFGRPAQNGYLLVDGIVDREGAAVR